MWRISEDCVEAKKMKSSSWSSVSDISALSSKFRRDRVEGVDNALIKGEIESQWTGLIALLV
ncbi:hypothetical protein U9M48_039988 [Paspalum notatum var. saurae]|uniref:Uncharacterized protein n=1 Tax=Paspalum notatum var. saurae TaxID=547442 RepID=A0AAQ3XDP1_PASNO